MSEPTEKKKLPLWLKVFIAIVIVIVLLGFISSLGMTLISGLFYSKGEKFVEKGIEKWIEHTIENQGKDVNVDINISDKSLVVKSKDSGERLVIRSDATLPQGFPDDIPLPQNSRIITSATIGPMKSVALETHDSFEKTTAFYKNNMKDRGWEMLMQATNADKHFSGVFRKNKHHLTVAISAESEKIIVSLNYREQ